MSESPIKVEPARPFDSKPSWRGKYYFNGWNYVRNREGGLILYASEEAARAGAIHCLREKQNGADES